MKRLFVAIGASEMAQEVSQVVIKLRISADRKEIDIQWARPENLHITLNFLGDVNEDALPQIKKAIEQVAQNNSDCAAKATGENLRRVGEGVNLKVRGLSGFSSPESTRVIYMGVGKSQALLDLQSALESELAKIGFAFHESSYTPHITIARLRNPKNIEDLISPFVRKDFGVLQVKEIALFESHQRGPYRVYEKLLAVSI